jgi:molybdate transport system substrate-binding protein
MLGSPSPRLVPPNPVRVFAAGAVKAVVLELAPGFEAETGRRLEFVFDTVGALRDRVLSGEAADVTILSAQALDVVASRGFTPSPVLDLGTTGVALAGKHGTGFSTIETAEQFRDVLVSAGSIAYADPERGATAGKHFVAVLDRMNLSGTLNDRLRKFPFGVDAIVALGRGQVDVAVSQATEILTQPEVSYLGLFPEPYQLSTPYGAVALSDSEGARQFMTLLAGPAAASSLQRAGFV